jgi:hypothetical protein
MKQFVLILYKFKNINSGFLLKLNILASQNVICSIYKFKCRSVKEVQCPRNEHQRSQRPPGSDEEQSGTKRNT